MRIEARNHKEVWFPARYDTGNGAPKRGFSQPKKWAPAPKPKVNPYIDINCKKAQRWVTERMLEPHNSRRHCIIKIDKLLELERIAIAAQVMGSNPLEFDDTTIGNILAGIKKLKATGNMSFRVL